MITYNDIYEAARKERYSDQLQELPKNFVQNLADYLREKKEFSLKEDDNFSDVISKTKKQLENARTLFKELMLRRRRKILNLILIAAETGISKKDFENMLDFEKGLFEEFMKCIDSSDKKVSESLNGKKENHDNKFEKIVFMENVDEFMNLEGEKTGPFKKGEKTLLQKEIAKILIDAGKAEKI